MRYNEFNQPIGSALPNFCAGSKPEAEILQGQCCRLEKLSAAKHLDDLYEVYGEQSPQKNWTYLPIERLSSKAELAALLAANEASADPYYFAIIDENSGKAAGTFALMRIDAANRTAEVGWVIYSETLQRTRAATEAQYLLAKYVFETLKYRRYEWKCDALNAPSRKAAQRLGFQYEGTFRQAAVYKGRNRDTAWFSMLDNEWPQIKCRFEQWLDDANFDEQGKQRSLLNPMLSEKPTY